MNYIPKEVLDDFFKWFDYKSNSIYCQVASSFRGISHIRTMRFYDITDDGLLFFSRMDSQKWKDWQENTSTAILFFNEDYGQIILNGNILVENNNSKIKEYWENFPKQIQQIYPQYHDLGVIYIIPYQWEVFKINKKDYLASSKIQYKFIKDDWQREVMVVCG